MFCQPSEADAAGIIAAGATFDYDCAITTEIAAGQVLPGDITIDWLISAHSEGAWSIQVMSPWVDEGRWSEPGFQQEELAITSSGPESLATGVAGELAGTVTLPFGIRLFRPACDAALPFIQVEATVLASVPLNDAVVTERTSDQPAPLTLAPLLAAVPDIAPAVSIEYVAVDPVPFSLSEQTTNGSIAIRIDNPIVQCRSWTVQVSIATYAGSTPVGVTTVTAAGAIENATGDGFVQFAIDPALGLGPSASVSTVQPGAAPGSFTQTIDFVVILPGQLSAGVLTVQATASVVP
jgi:hypothetical protein